MTDATDTRAPVTFARGDGIGPEIMDATLLLLDAAGARIDWDEVEIGRAVFERGHSAGIEPSTWDSLRRTKVFLKAPITTPQGGGFKSLNVTTRKTLGLYANVRPCVSYHPAVTTKHPAMDVVVIRENEEDTYAGIEYRQTREATQCLKLITRAGCERIVRYGFEYARIHERKRVTCIVKDNIMKITDGLFRQVFEEMAEEYPDLESDHMIVDIAAARLADTPERFDVMILPNLYGDVLSDIAAQITGSVGLCGSSNVGEACAMFEAIHGSAPDIAGKGIANPSGLLLGATMMLVHVGQPIIAARLHNAWLRTIEDGMHTGDIYKEGHSAKLVNTKGFTRAVLDRMGQEPLTLAKAHYGDSKRQSTTTAKSRIALAAPRETKELVGVDLFLDWEQADPKPEVLAKALQSACSKIKGIGLRVISSRGVMVWPEFAPETYLGDHWRCRFEADTPIKPSVIVALLDACQSDGFDVIKTENLYTFDGKRGYSVAQGA